MCIVVGCMVCLDFLVLGCRFCCARSFGAGCGVFLVVWEE